MPTPDLLAEATTFVPELVDLRRRLHRVPEVGLDLPLTQAAVLEALAPLELEVTTGTALSSVTAVLRGAKPGPVVLLRADMDALPVTEESDEPVHSEHVGRMHACGHDLHMTGLIGAARLLHAHRDELPGTVVLMFQPGEEGQHGARLMIEEGVLDAAGDRAVAAYGLHVFSARHAPSGVATAIAGTEFAAVDTLHAVVRGRGGHGSAPHLAADPVPVAAEIVLAIQTMVTRKFDIFDPVVVTVGRITAGIRDNVIPAHAEIEATVRTFSARSRALIQETLTAVVEHVAAAHGLTGEVEYERGYPTTDNTPAEVERAARVAVDVLGEGAWLPMERPIAAAEDFSYLLEQVPGAFVVLGATAPGKDVATAAYNHSALTTFDESVLPRAAALLAGLAIDRLNEG
jgi:hippurate hydrolase